MLVLLLPAFLAANHLLAAGEASNKRNGNCPHPSVFQPRVHPPRVFLQQYKIPIILSSAE
jgi:hypothetical protein